MTTILLKPKKHFKITDYLKIETKESKLLFTVNIDNAGNEFEINIKDLKRLLK